MYISVAQGGTKSIISLTHTLCLFICIIYIGGEGVVFNNLSTHFMHTHTHTVH